MEKFIINVSWSMYGYYEIEAETLEEAEAKVLDPGTPLPTNGEYIEDSFKIEIE